MSGRTAKIFRKYCLYTGRSRKVYRNAKKRYSSLPWDKRENAYSEIYDQMIRAKHQIRGTNA